MASEWIGVIGTSIGAGIGGVVTVASLVVKGRQDESSEKRREARDGRLRSEDRKWQLVQQNADERRAMYAELLGTANNVVNGLGVLYASTLEDPGSRFEDWANAMAPELISEECTKFRAAGRQVTLVAVDDSLLRGVIAFDLAAVEAVRVARTQPDQLLSHVQRLVKLRSQLQKGCRRDLGLDGEAVALAAR